MERSETMTRRIFCKILLVIVAVFSLLVASGVLSAQGRSEDAFERVKKVQELHSDALMARPGVVGTAIGLGQNNAPVVKVLLERPGVAGIPKKLDDVSVEVVVTGKFYALPKPDNPGKPDKPDKPGKPGGGKETNPKKRFDRPVPIGVSTGNENECSAGTIACRVTDSAGNVYALSNNHVYALENKASEYESNRVLQPGRYDAKPPCALKSRDVIGELHDFEPIVGFFPDCEYPPDNPATNTIDAAIALSSESDLGDATPSNGYGKPKSTTVPAVLEQPVQKYGRTSSLTKGSIVGVNVQVDVGYSSGCARFVDQIIVEGVGTFIQSGDSGSLLVTDPGRNPVGLLFAGNQSGTLAVANQIDLVLDRFGVTIDGE
jgi:hypothetical protein